MTQAQETRQTVNAALAKLHHVTRYVESDREPHRQHALKVHHDSLIALWEFVGKLVEHD